MEKNLRELLTADDPEETTEEKKEEIDEKLVQKLLEENDDIPPIDPPAVQVRIHLIETAR